MLGNSALRRSTLNQPESSFPLNRGLKCSAFSKMVKYCSNLNSCNYFRNKIVVDYEWGPTVRYESFMLT